MFEAHVLPAVGGVLLHHLFELGGSVFGSAFVGDGRDEGDDFVFHVERMVKEKL